MFEKYQTVCIDPLKKHKEPIKKSLRNVSLSFPKQLCEIFFFIKPGQNICPSCWNFCEEKTKITENESDDKLMIELDLFESRYVLFTNKRPYT